MNSQKLNSLASYLVSTFEEEKHEVTERGVKVNALVSELASWYEKMRNAVEYREEEAVLRAAIERILRRRLMLGGNGASVAQILVRELIWARYFPDGSITNERIDATTQTIDFYLGLQKKVSQQKKIPEGKLHDFIFHLMSARIEEILSPSPGKEAMVSVMYHILRKNVVIGDDTEQERDIQLFVAIRKAFAKNDIPLLQYHLFQQYFEGVEFQNLDSIAGEFVTAYKDIDNQLHYPIQHKMYSYVKRMTPPFLILYDLLQNEKKQIREIVTSEETLNEKVLALCKEKYASISSKVQRAILRSVIFIFLTKVVIALAVEGTYDSVMYGEIQWFPLSLNIVIPPILMGTTAFFVRSPGEKNTKIIRSYIDQVLYAENPDIGYDVKFFKVSKRKKSFMYGLFTILWLAMFFVSFGLIIWGLRTIGFNIMSQAIFLFFLAIVMFLIYRIRQTAHEFTVTETEDFSDTLFNFFFMPFAQIGRRLAEGVAQVNIFLFLLDFLIEAPFKMIVGFFEDWFFFLREKKEELG